MILIGDIHCDVMAYMQILQIAESKEQDSIQLGDLCINHAKFYSQLNHLFTPQQSHTFFGGNHDDYSIKHDKNMGDFGMYNKDIFWVRGAYSVDKFIRQNRGMHWDDKEELSNEQMSQCIELYRQSKPSIVLSHEAPRFIADIIGSPDVLRMFGYEPSTFSTRTSEFLQNLYEIHQPSEWYFGHYHKSWKKLIGPTLFRCLNIGEWCEI